MSAEFACMLFARYTPPSYIIITNNLNARKDTLLLYFYAGTGTRTRSFHSKKKKESGPENIFIISFRAIRTLSRSSSCDVDTEWAKQNNNQVELLACIQLIYVFINTLQALRTDYHDDDNEIINSFSSLSLRIRCFSSQSTAHKHRLSRTKLSGSDLARKMMMAK